MAIGFEAAGASGPSYRYLAWWSQDGGRTWRPAGHSLHGPLTAVPVGDGFIGLGAEVWLDANWSCVRWTTATSLTAALQTRVA